MSNEDGVPVPVPVVANRKRCRDDHDEDNDDPAAAAESKEEMSSEQVADTTETRQNKRLKREGGLFSYATSLWTSFTGFFFGVEKAESNADNSVHDGPSSNATDENSPACNDKMQLDQVNNTKTIGSNDVQVDPSENNTLSDEVEDTTKITDASSVQTDPSSEGKVQSGDVAAASLDNHGESTGEPENIERSTMTFKSGDVPVVNAIAIEEVDHGFEEKFTLLLEYKKKYGTFTIVGKAEEKYLRLRSFVAQMRHQYRQGNIQKQRKQALEEIGFLWNGRDARKEEQWENNFEQLIAFKEKHGHFIMKSYGEEYQALWNW
eukprot:CAMPEP_0116021198 /NCGR_PEP_ID=MMETSP0321-20121206/10241_1 /TAXON_ID=163516 /ORGANISM="Leptocylindrus danicus var. danicus, Strain B650" /LENGTH=319 /DNA_ID=CAMNT_0003492017 /DNA_START=38 /DNA_END=994 /DNA_ORIENTATION=-